MRAPSPVSLRSACLHRLLPRELTPASPTELKLLGVTRLDARPVRVALALPLPDRSVFFLPLERTPEDAGAFLFGLGSGRSRQQRQQVDAHLSVADLHSEPETVTSPALGLFRAAEIEAHL